MKRSRSRPAGGVAGGDLHILRLIDEGTAAKTGAAFFRALVQRLAEALDCEFAFVSRFCEDYRRVHVIAFWTGETIREHFDYPLPGSPCERVLGGDIVAYDRDVARLFPSEREQLQALGAEAYLAIPLKNQGGEVLGHLAVIARREKNWQARDLGILRIFAARTTAEIERQQAEEQMQAVNLMLGHRVELEALIAAISTRFVSADPGSVGREIDFALAKVGAFIGSDRGLVYLFDESRRVARLAHEWVAGSCHAASPRLAEIRADVVPEVIDFFVRRGRLNAARPEDLPPGFAALNTLPQAEHVVSRIAVPVVDGSDARGILCFHSLHQERRWPPEDQRLLGLLAEIIGSAMAREQAEVALQRAKDAAEAANRAKSEFLASMSHELRTPLNGVLGYAQLIKRQPTLPASAREGLDAIERCGAHLLTLIGDVLDLAKIEAGRIELESAAFDLDEFLREVADIARVRAAQSALQFRCDADPQLPAGVVADQRKLRQVLLNLLGNAVKFTERGSVSLRAGASTDANGQCRLHFEVEDTGIGIPDADLERIFEPFHQVRESGYHAEGTGLGLAICRKLTDVMGGTLTVRTRRGQGSVFSVDLPVGLGECAALRALPPEGDVNGYVGPRRRILVADDKQDNRHVLGEFLRSLGFEVTEAASGAEVLAAAGEQLPDMAWLDLVMPGMDGFQTLRALRALPGGARLPVVALSASVFDATRAECDAAGFDAFVAKPVGLDEVVALTGRHLALQWTAGVLADRVRSPAAQGGAGAPTDGTAATVRAATGRDVTGSDAAGSDAGRGDAASSEAAGVPGLSPAVIQSLLELARMGDVRGLDQRIAEARGAACGCESLLDELAALARSYDMRALRARLAPLAAAMP